MLTCTLHDVYTFTSNANYRVSGIVTVKNDSEDASSIIATVSSVLNQDVVLSGVSSLDIGFDFRSTTDTIVILVKARDNAYPVPFEIETRYSVNASNADQARVKSSLLFGPVLDSTGVLKKGYGIDAISSQVRTLLTTKAGDRLMMPEYGTNLSSVIFSPAKDSDLLSQVKSEITRALSVYIPSVTVSSASLEKDGNQAKVNIQLVIANQSFSLSLDYHA